ncbi:adenosylcobinamide-GDP ribazoletransferase [Spongisporangium articulatum]|uniref:Adenosylcobinamide-GDP ribazoletransferase n=1 Tax=Spongisporangium articulatum TaxID=3362603 RepID=A0ABW8ASY9_9ACTN
MTGSLDDAAATRPPRLVDPLLLAFGTLTALRVPAPRSLVAPIPGRAMLLAPVAGLFPGGLAALTAWGGWQLGWDPLVVAVLAVAVLQLATRGLHLDGLADFADGSAASYDREKALSVMRRGDTGPAGLATTVTVLLLQVAALAQLLSLTVGGPVTATFREAVLGDGQDGLFYGGDLAPAATVFGHVVPVGALGVLLVAVAARLAIPLACLRSVPAARPEGLGATVAGSVRLPSFLVVAVLVTVLLGLLGTYAGLDAWQVPVAVGVALVVAALVVRRAVKRFGGITGDVIGAAVELSTAAALLALCS